MPHVRKQEYKVPSKEYELEYVEVIQRHHKRTPYASNTFFKEDISWDCSKEGPYHYAKDANGLNTAPVYWQAQANTRNPFEYTVGLGFLNSTCQFPSITSQGLDDAYIHGKDLRGVYHDKLKFLPNKGEKDKYKFRVTNNVITSQTLSGLVKGLFPGGHEYDAWIQSDSWDSLEPSISCALKNTVASAITDISSEWGIHLNSSLALRERFYNVSGIEWDDDAGWSTSWDHAYDNLSAKQCHGKPLPCSLNNTAICTPQEDADAIYRLGNYEYAYKWRMAENSTLYSALTMGAWFIELQDHINGKIDGSNNVKYFHNFAHDGSISPVLGVLQIDKPMWPGMGTEVVFELWKKKKTSSSPSSSPYFIRVLLSGQPLETSTPLGTLDMVPWDEFERYLNETIPEDLVGMCARG
ncbi:acid phosphatase [Cryptococcus neoformans]|nr:acid phosphatase [Cryptococcus neoformans var. grubii]OXC58292.1 acid phosphatase [Cryptococcus neoformans var. grubii MW-RSA852]